MGVGKQGSGVGGQESGVGDPRQAHSINVALGDIIANVNAL